jgi:hypothetical protein
MATNNRGGGGIQDYHVVDEWGEIGDEDSLSDSSTSSWTG